jgi:MFS family permease
MRHILRSLRYPNFRLFYAGQLVSLIGTWMQTLAQSWLMYRLTQSATWLGLAGAASLLPSLFLGLYGGVLADRFPRRKLLLAAQTLAMVQAFAFAALTLLGHVQPWHILVLALLLGVVTAFEMPARQSFLSELVPRADLNNAIALNASLFHLARFIGPAIAGVLVASIGEGWVFFINGWTFVAVLIGLFAMRLPPMPGSPRTGGLHAVREGLSYAWHHTTTRATVAMVATVSFVGMSASVLMPVFAARVFHGGAHSLGWLMGAMGVGALAAALSLARRTNIAGIERVITLAGLGGGVALVAFGGVKVLGFALLVLPLLSFAITSMLASGNTLVQLTVPDRLRGRVMSLFTVAMTGTMPLGQLIVGASADRIGAPLTVAICGGLLFAAAAIFGTVMRRLERRAPAT